MPDRGTMLAALSTTWTAFWTWYLFRDLNLPAAGLLLVCWPIAATFAAVLIRRGKASFVVRMTVTGLLFLWGILLFAWMFLGSAALMALAMADASTNLATDSDPVPSR